jgi:D-beta-D-heptose 7-phosphate kinase/D-beta-D-heptose 1-phosphate adenosyltransferase
VKGAATGLAELARERALWRATGERVALTNGCFDLLHPGHLSLLEQARKSADRLVVAINSDASVRALKGPERPLVPEAERAETLLALEAVDRVVVYDEPTPLEVIERLLPDVLAKGADWPLDRIVGREPVLAAGGRVVRIELVPDRSTTRLVERIRSR